MRWMSWSVLTASLLVAVADLRASDSVTPPANSKERIGVYDSRAVAVAYAGSAVHNKSLSVPIAEHQKAKAAGDRKRLAELELEGAARQTLMHKQAFSTAPVDNILEQIKAGLPAIMEKAGVSALVSKWDKDSLAKHPSAELVDVTSALIDAFNPNDRQRKRALEIQKHAPIPFEQAEKIKD